MVSWWMRTLTQIWRRTCIPQTKQEFLAAPIVTYQQYSQESKWRCHIDDETVLWIVFQQVILDVHDVVLCVTKIIVVISNIFCGYWFYFEFHLLMIHDCLNCRISDKIEIRDCAAKYYKALIKKQINQQVNLQLVILVGTLNQQ